jgi:hypothetical protein
MKVFTCNSAQDEVIHHRLRAGSKKNPTLAALPARRETRHSRGKAAAILTRERMRNT